VVWVEIKDGADLHENQLQNYLDDQARLGITCGAVVLLAPRPAYPFDQVPPSVPQRTWQATAARCARWSAGHPDPNSKQEFLRGELVSYLKAKGLMDPEVITPLHLAQWEFRVIARRELLAAGQTSARLSFFATRGIEPVGYAELANAVEQARDHNQLIAPER
jgi:hypothetical protein